MPSFSSHSTLAPTFQPSPFTLCSLPSSVFTVAMPLSSIAVTFPFIVPPAKARVVPKTKLAQVRAKDFPSCRIISYPPHFRDRFLSPIKHGTLIASIPPHRIWQKGLTETVKNGLPMSDVLASAFPVYGRRSAGRQ